MHMCTNCQTLEGVWRDASPKEMKEWDLDEPEDLRFCAECDSPETESYKSFDEDAGGGDR